MDPLMVNLSGHRTGKRRIENGSGESNIRYPEPLEMVHSSECQE